MAKKLSDYSWVKIYWADLFSDTAGMSDNEFRNFFVAAYRSWRSDKYEELPSMFAKSADDIRDISKSRGKRNNSDISNDKTSYDDISNDKTSCLSPLLSSPLSISISSGESTERGESVDALVSHCGLPKWEAQFQAVSNGLRKAIASGIEIDRQIISIGIKNYAMKCVAEKTEDKFIRDVDNWLADGDWRKYQVTPSISSEQPKTTPKNETWEETLAKEHLKYERLYGR
jgi:hypothetical protein